MTPALSAYLNGLRFLAALVVLASHMAYSRFTDGAYLWIRELNLGSDAVVLFFVLSGFVIAYTADRKHSGLGGFLFDRATRLWSVALPALLLGFVLDRIGAARAPELYAPLFYEPLPLWRMLLTGLTFSGEWTGQGVRLGSNGPYWSLSYEAAYYLTFAFVLYTTGAKRVLLLFIAVLVFGVKVLFLAPSWVFGVLLYRYLAKGGGLGRGLAWAAVLGPPVLYGLSLAWGVPPLLRGLTAELLSPNALLALRFSDEFLWNGLIGALFALHLLGAASLLRGARIPGSPAIGWLAGASFSIYLVHYPMLQFLGGVLPETGTAAFDHGFLFAAVLGACFGFAELFERPLRFWRAMASKTVRPLQGIPGGDRAGPGS